MSLPAGFDPTPPRTAKLPALVADPIHGVLPFDGALNPLTRSNTSHRVSMAFATPATRGQRKIYHFGSEGESSVALIALLSPEFHGLEVQLPPFEYRPQGGEKPRKHFFDLRVTFRDGFRRAIYVKNGKQLRTRKIQAEINSIFKWIPCEFADEAIVVNSDDFTRAYRDNLRRAWYLHQQPDPEADNHVEAIARNSSFWFLKDLVEKCDLPPAVVWRSAMRLITRGVLGANWHAVINIHSRVWLNE
mgnify:CR=1 FL=1